MASLLSQAHRVAYVHEQDKIPTHRRPPVTRVPRANMLPTISESLEANGTVQTQAQTQLRRSRPVIRLIQGWKVRRDMQPSHAVKAEAC
jgi:hypothetical protein